MTPVTTRNGTMGATSHNIPASTIRGGASWLAATRSAPLVVVLGASATVTGAASGCSDERVQKLDTRVTKLETEVASMKEMLTRPPPSVSTSDPRAACSRAKVACVDGWDKALPGAEAARNRAGVGWHDKSHGWNSPELYNLPKAAREACSTKGAIRIRDAGRAVKAAEDRPEIAVAKQASEAAFEACKDVEP